MFKFVRKVLFWAHLVAGVAAGLIILVMASTGVLLSYERQITEAANGFSLTPPANGKKLGPEELLAALQAAQPGAAPSGLTIQADPGDPAFFQFGREKTVFVDPYTGAVLGEGAKKTRAFFQFVTGLHRWLAMKGDAKDVGQGITSAAAIVFFFLILSGLVIWIPKRWTKRGVKVITMFQGKLKGRARDWNWHNVLGIWFALPLLTISGSGLVIAYPWANALLFRMVGESPPPPRGQGGPQAGAGAKPSAGASGEGRQGGGERSGMGGNGGERRQEGGGRPERAGGRGEGRPGPGGEGREPAAPVSTAGWNRAFAIAEGLSKDWASIQFQLPQGKDAVLAVSDSHRGRPDLKQTVTIDLESGEVRKLEKFDDQSLGRRLRTWVRWIHTGEAGGWAGQALAGLAAAAAVMLVWTGLALSWRRFFKKKAAVATSESI